MDILSGSFYLSLLMIVAFKLYVLFVILYSLAHRDWSIKTIVRKCIAASIAVALILGLPKGMIREAYPKEAQGFQQFFDQEGWKWTGLAGGK